MFNLLCGISLVILGAAMLIHNDALVRRSSEFYGFIPPSEFDFRIALDRCLCALVGLFCSSVGFDILSGH